MSVSIRVHNLSKAYQLGQIGTGTISRDLERWVAKLRGKEDPFLKIGETNDRTTKGTSDIVWSLKDVSFDIEQGDAVGIIGRNGAGKSTLLKILSRVTTPTRGEVKVKGRIASLLEVGTGFHPELTGRENIYLNGAILGMRKKEIARKLEQIIDFSGVERYVDTPVKRYSSGMYVRLAFAVAAHLESEILIVDEVLAVGDAEFQEKCIGKMNDVSQTEGRTVLFVSHNMSAIAQLCKQGILLNKGTIATMGKIDNVLEAYSSLEKKLVEVYENKNAGSFEITKVMAINEKGDSLFNFSDSIQINISVKLPGKLSGLHLGMAVNDRWKRKIFTTQYAIRDHEFSPGILEKQIFIPSKLLLTGSYSLDVASFIPNSNTYMYLQDICPFRIQDMESDLAIYGNTDIGAVNINCVWE